VVTIRYSDESSKVVTGYTTDPAAGTTLNRIGSQTVSVTYTENGVSRRASFPVDVVANSAVVPSRIDLTQLPTKRTYTQGDSLNLAGLVVQATYSDGRRRIVSGYTTNPAAGAALNTIGSRTVSVTYTENGVSRTASFTVNVESRRSSNSSSSSSQSSTLPTRANYGTISASSSFSGSGTATFTIDAPYSSFYQLTLNGGAVDPSNYTAVSGSTIITFKESYLNTLPPGNHSFRAEFLAGDATLNLTVSGQGGSNTTNTTANQAIYNPQTGIIKTLDYIAIFAVLLLAVVFFIRKKNGKREV
jgi:hypothetical protein